MAGDASQGVLRARNCMALSARCVWSCVCLCFMDMRVCLSVRGCVCAMSEYSVITRARCGDAERVSLDDGVASCASPGVAGPSPTV